MELSELSSAALVKPCAALPLEHVTANEPGISVFFLLHSNHERAHTGHFVWDVARIELRKGKRKLLCQISIQRLQRKF